MLILKRNISLVLCAAIGLFLFWRLFYAPLLAGDYPDALPHRIDREKAEEIAVNFVRKHLPDDRELRSFAMYDAERWVFGYLMKEQKIGEFTDAYMDRLPLELYRVEVVEGETNTRHTVDVNPYTGEPVEWNLQIYGDRLSDYELIEEAEKWLKDRGWKEHSTFYYTDNEFGTVVYNLTVPGLKLVQSIFQIDSGGIRSLQIHLYASEYYNSLVASQDFKAYYLSTAGLIMSSAMQLGAIIYSVRFRRYINWQRGAVLAIIFAMIYCFSNINMYPGAKALVTGLADGGDYFFENQKETMTNLIKGMLIMNGFTLLLAVGLYFSLVAGDTLCRRRGWNLWPSGLEAGHGYSIVSSMWKGYAFAFIGLGLQLIFYMGAEQGFGTWYTVDASMSANNLLLPVLFPILSWCAAISEEGVYRLFGIPALKALFRFTFPAALVSSMIWAAQHVTYPTYPYYTRFVELTLLGLLDCYVFLKHGFLTAVFAHAIFDTIVFGISITANHPSALNWTAAILYLLLPIVIAYAMAAFERRRRKRNPSEPEEAASGTFPPP